MFLGENVHLLRLEASVREHANLQKVSMVGSEGRNTTYLVGDMIPIVFAAQILEILLEKSSHLNDAVSHALDLTKPLLVESSIVEDFRSNAGTMDGRVGVQRSDQDLDLRVHTLLLFGRLADNGESTDTLAVETHVLRKALSKDKLVAFLNEESERVGIFVGVTTGESLVGHIEEGEVSFLLDDLADLLPLLRGWVDTGRVVGASVEHDHAVVRSSLEISNHTVEVESDGVLVVVFVLLDLQTSIAEDRLVVGPAGSRDVDALAVRVEALQECSCDPQGTGARD